MLTASAWVAAMVTHAGARYAGPISLVLCLAVYSTANQDSPIMQSDVPLLGIDVWEHAYYLKYQNKRPAYLEAWCNVVNWPEVERRFAEAQTS